LRAHRLLAPAACLALLASSEAAARQPRTVGEYNDQLVAVAADVMERVEDAEERFAFLEPGPRYEAWRNASLEAVALGLAQVDAIPPRDDDEGFHAAVRDGFARSERIIREIVSEAFVLSSKEPVANADLARFEALYRELDAEAERVDGGIQAAQRAFAKRHQMRLVDRRPRKHKERELPDFEARGIPPEGSRLPGQVHTGFAVRYGNAFVDMQNELSRASGSVVRADDAALERTREEALRTVREIHGRAETAEPWQGDDTLRAGVLEMARALETSLAGPTAEYAKLAGRKDLTTEQVERANAAIDAMNTANRGAHEAYRAAEAAFRERWAIDAYMAWSKARADADRERAERRQRREGRSEHI
jgi:hypothetical protein